MDDVRLNVRFAAICLVALIHCGGGDAPETDVGPLPQVDLSTLDADLADRLARAFTILRSKPDDASFNGEVGMMLHAYQQFDLAQEFYDRAHKIEPSGLRWPYYQGVIHARQGRYDDAIESFRSTLEIDPTFLPARKRLARAFLERRELDESLQLYGELVAEDPDDPEIRNGLGKVHAALGDAENAVIQLGRAVRIHPSYGEANYALALAYRDLGDEKSFTDHLKRYERDTLGAPSGLDPLMAAVSSLNISAPEYLKAGVEARDAGRIPEAIGLHLRALQLDPEFHQAHLNLIVFYGTAGETDSAKYHYQKALAINPDSAELHYNYGVLCYDEGNYNQAATSFQQALKINPDYAAANNNIGQMHELQGRLDEAITFYRRAVANRPDYGLAHYHLGRMMMIKQRQADAVREFRLALREESAQTPTYLMTLAAVYATLGDRSEAADTLDLARRMAERYQQDSLVQQIDIEISKLAQAGRP